MIDDYRQQGYLYYDCAIMLARAAEEIQAHKISDWVINSKLSQQYMLGNVNPGFPEFCGSWI